MARVKSREWFLLSLCWIWSAWCFAMATLRPVERPFYAALGAFMFLFGLWFIWYMWRLRR